MRLRCSPGGEEARRVGNGIFAVAHERRAVRARTGCGGHASLCPPLYGGGSQEGRRRCNGLPTTFQRPPWSVSLFDRGPFLRPDRDPGGAPRAAAVKAGRRGVGAASSTVARPRLDGGEHGARLQGRDEGSRDERRDVILDWAAREECGITA